MSDMPGGRRPSPPRGRRTAPRGRRGESSNTAAPAGAGGGRVYEVWLIPRQGNPVPAAVFVPDSNGSRVVLVNQSLKGYTLMAVTNEAGPDGAQAPTQPPQLYGSIA